MRSSPTLPPREMRGAAYGLRQSLDTIGALIGPLLAMALMLAWADDFRRVFWVAVIPAMLSFLLIVFAVRDAPLPVPKAAAEHQKISLNRATMRRLGMAFWGVTAAGAALTLARFSEAFLILRAENLQLAVALAPLVLVAMSVAYSATAYPAGRLADRIPPRILLFAGICRPRRRRQSCWRWPRGSWPSARVCCL